MEINSHDIFYLLGFIFSIGGVYVALTNRLTRVETRVDAHEKKHDAWDTVIQRVYDEIKEIKDIVLNNKKHDRN